MKNLLTLVKMQLKEKLNLKKLSTDKSFFNILVTIVFAVVKFAIVTAMCAALLIVVRELHLFSLLKVVPDSVMSLLFSVMLLLSIFSCTAGLTKAMYFSHDNSVLLTLPCTPLQVYLSKLTIFFIFELKKNFSFIVPLFIAYFLIHSYSPVFYVWLLVCFVAISLFTVSVGALLSVPAMWLSNIFRQNRSLQAGSIVITVGVAVWAVFYAISLIPAHVDLRANWPSIFWQIDNFLKNYTVKFSALYDVTRLILGETENFIVSLPFVPTMIRFLALLGVTAALLGLGLLIVKPLFYTMASKPFEYIKRKVKPRKNRRIHPRISAIYNEMLKTIKDSGKMFSNVAIMISVPILIFFLNKMFFAMNTNDFGDRMVVAFNLLIMLLIYLNSNTFASSIFSRDGRSAYLIKVQPTNPARLLAAKLLPSALFCIVSMVVTFLTLREASALTLDESIMMMLAVLFIYLAHLIFCAELDIMNPQTEVYAAMGEHENNPNETTATVTAFLISFLVAGLTLLLLIEAKRPVFPKLLIVGAALFAYRVWMFFSKIKLYYKEK